MGACTIGLIMHGWQSLFPQCVSLGLWFVSFLYRGIAVSRGACFNSVLATEAWQFWQCCNNYQPSLFNPHLIPVQCTALLVGVSLSLTQSKSLKNPLHLFARHQEELRLLEGLFEAEYPNHSVTFTEWLHSTCSCHSFRTKHFSLQEKTLHTEASSAAV